MSHGYNSGVYLLQVYSLTSSVNLENKPPPYIVGLAYYQLGGKHINVIASETIPNNTVLILTFYTAYHRNGTLNISGPGRQNIKMVMWASSKDPLYFPSNFARKEFRYSGYKKDAVNNVALDEFGKKANVIYSSHRSPVDINVFYYGRYWFTRATIFSSFNKLEHEHISYEKHLF